MGLDEFAATFDTETKIYKVFRILKDMEWHCRGCEYGHVRTTQIAGGSGIQGLQRGTISRPGMVISSDDHLCIQCDKKTRQDKWEGAWHPNTTGAGMPTAFRRRVVALLGNRDIIEQTERTPAQLTVDHKLPMIRWSPDTVADLTRYADMTDGDVQANFQLLKKSNGSVSHNLLKSRACERCYQSGKRGTPFGIRFFYAGSDRWEPDNKQDAKGCVGCGWYDFDTWREGLNQTLTESGNDEAN